MKKVLGLAIIALAMSSVAFAQKKEGKEEKENKESKVMVPAAVMQAFEKAHSGVKAKWDDEDGKYEAGFKQGKQEISVLYNANGSVEETEIEISISELPAISKAYVVNNKLGKIKEAAKITKANGTVEYEAEVKSGDVLFDSKGNFIQLVKE